MPVSDDLARSLSGPSRPKTAPPPRRRSRATSCKRRSRRPATARSRPRTKLRAESAGAADRADAWADNIQHSWDDHLARARERIDARKAQHAADRTESDAEDAESYAAYSIDLAYSAIEEAEYAVLEAVLARADADEAAPAVAP
jgi:hypothetical protein